MPFSSLPSPQSVGHRSDCASVIEMLVKNADSQGTLPEGLIHGTKWNLGIDIVSTSAPGD